MINLELWNAKRRELKKSLADIAKETEISISTIKDIFRGATTDPRIETVKRIERALGLNEQQKKLPQDLTEDEKKFLALISELTDEETQELSNYIDFIISKRKYPHHYGRARKFRCLTTAKQDK